MNRNELEHIIRAAGEIAQVKKVIVLGSQSILAQYPDLSESFPELNKPNFSSEVESCAILLRSIEADIMIPDSDEKTEMVEGSIGELSVFHNTHGYYAQGVDLATSKLPEGWENRLIEICNENTHGISGMCLEIHDLMISKLYAGRKKDIEFFQAAVNIDLLSKEILMERLKKASMSAERRRFVENQIERGFST